MTDTAQNRWTIDEDGDPCFGGEDDGDYACVESWGTYAMTGSFTVSDRAHAALVQCIRDADTLAVIRQFIEWNPNAEPGEVGRAIVEFLSPGVTRD